MNNKTGDEFKPHAIQWNTKKIQHLWDYYGTSNAHRSSYFGEQSGKHFVRVLRRRGLLSKAKNIVDFSCGTGAVIEAILKVVDSNSSVTGYDVSALSIEETNLRNKSAMGFNGAHKIKEYPTNIQEESVDLLIMTEVIEHLEDNFLDAILTECYRIMAPNGVLVITTPYNENLARSNVICPECGCIFHRWQHLRYWNKESLDATLRKYGLKPRIVKQIEWGNEIIDLAFSILRKRKSGMFVISSKV